MFIAWAEREKWLFVARGRAAAHRPCLGAGLQPTGLAFGAGLQPTGPALLAPLLGGDSGEQDRRGPQSKSPGFPASEQLQAVLR